MANSDQVRKRIRQATKAYERNKQAMTTIRTFKKKTLQSLLDNKIEEASSNFKKFTSLTGKAVSKKLIHKNTAARWVSRVNSQIKKAVKK
jgi:small subunit ribosomal protein S20